jgi:DNA replication protein DnaC
MKEVESVEKKHWRKHSNIPQEYWEYKWFKKNDLDKHYDPKFNIDKLAVGQKTIKTRENARNVALSYVKNLKENLKKGKSLYIVGGKSSGKTRRY